MHERRCVELSRIGFSDADADFAREASTRYIDLDAFARAAQVLGHGTSRIQGSVEKHHEELVPTVSTLDIRCSERPPKRTPDRLEHPITREVSVPVVDGLEVVHVEHQDRHAETGSAWTAAAAVPTLRTRTPG